MYTITKVIGLNGEGILIMLYLVNNEDREFLFVVFLIFIHCRHYYCFSSSFQMHKVDTTEKIQAVMQDVGEILKRMPQIGRRKNNMIENVLHGKAVPTRFCNEDDC